MATTATALVHSAVHIEDRIHRIFDHLYANAPIRTPRGIAYEAGKVIHASMFIESRKSGPAFEFNRSELKRIEAGEPELVKLVAASCRDQFRAMNKVWQLYPLKEELILGDFDLAFVCAKLSGVLVGDKRRDVFGDALEIFRYEWAKRNGGQFFTDQRVTHLAVALLRFNPTKGDDLVDLCAGTGGFLLAGLNAIQSLTKSSLSESDVIQLAHKSLKGQEADREVAEICNGTLSARLGGERAALVACGNSLHPSAFTQAGSQAIKYDTHLCAATNPPFGTKITVRDPEILRHFELAYANFSSDSLFSNRFSPKAPDILFIEQNLRILKPGQGRLAIVVPYQISSGPQTQFVREWILKNAQVLAVVDLPVETFQPHTGTKTCLLVLERRQKPLENLDSGRDGAVFMATPKWIGHDRRGNPIYKRNPDGTVSDEILSDLATVAEAFKLFLKGNDPGRAHQESFAIEASAIFRDPSLRFNAQFHRPYSDQIKLPSLTSAKGSKKSGWRTEKLGDIVERVFYPGRFKRNYVQPSTTAVPFLGGTNISQLLIKTDKWIDAQAAETQQLTVRPGWLLVTRSGSTGIVSSVPKAWSGFAVSEHVIRIVPDNKRIEHEYLLAFLRTKYAQEALAKGVYGSVIDEINPDFICGLEVPIPPQRVLESVVRSVRVGESARNESIERLVAGVDELEAEMAAI